MSGTVQGGIKMRDTNYRKRGLDYYAKIGAKGGSAKHPDKGFGSMNTEKAKAASRLGGMISRRNGKLSPVKIWMIKRSVKHQNRQSRQTIQPVDKD